jgi:hypothetical protein
MKERLELVKNAAHYMLQQYNVRQIGAWSASGGTNNAMAGALARKYGVPFITALQVITPILNTYLDDCNKFVGRLEVESDFVDWQEYLPE